MIMISFQMALFWKIHLIKCLVYDGLDTIRWKIKCILLPLLSEPIIKKYTKIIDGVPMEITEKETREERIITGNL